MMKNRQNINWDLAARVYSGEASQKEVSSFENWLINNKRVPNFEVALKSVKTYFAISRFSRTLLRPHRINILYKPKYSSGTLV